MWCVARVYLCRAVCECAFLYHCFETTESRTKGRGRCLHARILNSKEQELLKHQEASLQAHKEMRDVRDRSEAEFARLQRRADDLAHELLTCQVSHASVTFALSHACSRFWRSRERKAPLIAHSAPELSRNFHFLILSVHAQRERRRRYGWQQWVRHGLWKLSETTHGGTCKKHGGICACRCLCLCGCRVKVA